MLRSFMTVLLSGAGALWALTGGPSQPEYTGFTPSQKTDLVDLYTGDFSYSIPLLTVPGPSMNYPIVLGYHGGITNEQASSWVGLGWSLNPGAINRTLNRYPDDYANGKSKDVLSGSDVVTAWDVGVSYMGIGLSVGQRSDHGWHGGLEVGMDGVDVQLSLDQKDGFGIQPPAMLKERFEGMITGAITGAASSALDGASNELLGSEGIGLSTSVTAHSLSVSVNGVGFGSSSVSSGAFHDVSHSLSIPVGNTGFVVSFSSSRAWLHKVEDVTLFGYLNLSKFPKEIPGLNSHGNLEWETRDKKMEYNWAPDQPTVEKGGNSFESWFMDLIFKQKAFVTSTPDGYQARAEGMSMSFRPYRQDIGDYYGQERLEARVGYWLNIVNSTWLYYLPFFGHITKDEKERYDRNLGENATQFVDQSNSIPDNQATDYFLKYQSTDHQYPVTVFRENGTSGGAFLGETWRTANTNPADRCTGYNCDLEYRHRNNGQSGSPAGSYVDPNILKPSSGEYPDRISGGSGIFPIYKNVYDVNGTDPSFHCNTNPDIPQCDPAVPLKALIGFTLIRPDGMVYEYHKPVFNWNQKVASLTRPSEDKTQGAYDFGDITRTSSMYRAYATSWLLTAIKSPDYVDMGSSGLGDEDIGSWVSFEYGHHIRRFSWRTPYEGSNPIGIGNDEHLVDGSDLTFQSYGQASWGSKEVYFLSTIRTPSHEARFISSLKDQNDGAEAKLSDGAGIEATNRISVNNLSPESGDHIRIKYTVTSPDASKNNTCTIHTDYNEEFDITSVAAGDPALNADNGIEVSHVATLDHAMHSNSCGAEIHRVEILSRQHPEDHTMRKLDRIELYRRDNNSLISAVDFGYETVASKQLARGVPDVPGFDRSSDPNTWKGKLTLRQVTIGDGNVQLPPYKFSYYMEGNAAPYNRMHFDRWGYYKHNGGLVNTDFLKGSVVDWDFLLQILKGQVVPPAPIGSFSATVLRNSLLQALDQADVTAITNSASGTALREGYKTAIVKALNRIKDGLTFYTDDRALPSPHLPNPGNLSDDFKSNTWAGRAVDLGLINSNGVLVKSISLMSDEEKNILRGLNMTLLSRYLYYQETPKKQSLFRDFLINHFDHETDPNDVKAWSLKQVSLPSGGKIDVEYESDDFVYLGKTRAMDLADVDKFKGGGGLDYFKNIGQEKSSYSSSGLLKIDSGMLGSKYWENPDQVKLRVSSLFHIFRKKKDGTGWEYTPPFAKLKKWVDDSHRARTDPKYKDLTDPKYRLHLLGWYSDLKVNQNIFTGGNCGDGNLVDQNGNSPGALGYLAPFDIGPVVQDFDLTDGDDAFKEAHQCQRNFVDFDLTRFVASNLEAANKLQNVPNPCSVIKSDPKRFLKDMGFLTLGWARAQDPTDYTDWPLFIPIQSAPPADVNSEPVFNKYVDLSSPRFNHLPKLSEMYSTNPATTSLLLKPCNPPSNPPRPDGCTLTYLDGTEWKGPARWDALSEFSTHYADDSWGFMSFNVGKRVTGGDPVAMAAGIPGGGLRVKRLSFNSGWPQRTGEPPQTQVTEYAYTCSPSKGGLYSSGATASIPPPYNNYGDDRVPLPPEASLVEGAPSVGYRKVTEIRPGRGKIVYDFLSPADVYDFIGYENCNQVRIENGFITGLQAGCYDKDDEIYWNEMSHARWKLNRMAQFQGLLIGKSKLSEKKADGTVDTVASEKYRFLTSLSNDELGELSEAALLNNSDAIGSADALIGTNDAQISAGSRDYKFRRHPTSDFMGQTIERMRLRWYFKQDDPEAEENTIKDKIGLNEMEIVEHSIRQCEVISKTQGVGTRTRHAFYDFLTGEPVVSVTSPLKKGDVDDPALPTKTTVTVPAHWVPEYNPSNGTGLSMGSIYDDPNFFNLATGNLSQSGLKNITGTMTHRNMLTQTFSQSIYSGLTSFYSTCPANQTNCPEWWTLLNGTNIMNRKITTWDIFGQGGTAGNAWRISKTLDLRLPMEKVTVQGPIRVNVDRGTLNYPFPAQGEDVFDEYLMNEAYVTENTNTEYGDLGEVLESQDAYENSVSSFYQGHKFLVGQVLNSDLANCAVTSMDEWAHESPPSDIWTLSGSAVLTDAKARSGNYSLSLPNQGDKITAELNSAHPGNYELSVWTKQSNYALGAYAISVRGQVVKSGLLSYDPSGPEWQRTVMPFTADFISLTADIKVELSHVPASGQMWLDDVRLAPADAQVFTLTYDNRGYRSSEADPNDILMRYDYDAFGRLTEVRDGQGVLVSTQAQLEAK